MSHIYLTFFKSSLFILLLVLGISTVNAQTKVEAKLQNYTIKIGDQTKLFLVVDQPINDRVNFPALTDTITEKLQIVSINKPDTLVDKKNGNHITITQAITITGFDPGTQIIPGFDFVTSSGTLKSNSLTLQVQTVKVDTTKAIYDIKQPMAVSYTFVDWLRDNWMWVAAGFAILALVVYLIYYLRNRRKAEPVIKEVKPPIPAHTIAINKLNDLKAKKLWQQDEFKQYHSELTDIVREYLEQRYNIKTYEKTTDEIMASLNNRNISSEYLNILQQTLKLADLAKFAKLNPLPHENETSMDNSLAFVLKTQQGSSPIINTEGGSANESV